jgi:import receptor subunit TOM7
MALNPITKQRIAIVLDVSKFVFQWGFIPAVLFLG